MFYNELFKRDESNKLITNDIRYRRRRMGSTIVRTNKLFSAHLYAFNLYENDGRLSKKNTLLCSTWYNDTSVCIRNVDFNFELISVCSIPKNQINRFVDAPTEERQILVVNAFVRTHERVETKRIDYWQILLATGTRRF